MIKKTLLRKENHFYNYFLDFLLSFLSKVIIFFRFFQILKKPSLSRKQTLDFSNF
jgi:hypothetical protein